MFIANDPDPIEPFFLIVADRDRGVFAVEGPMTDDGPWEAAVKFARSDEHRIACGPRGNDRDALATEFCRPTILPVFRRAAS